MSDRWFCVWLVQLVCVAGVLSVCPYGFVDYNGQCVQQASTCPANYYLANGLCLPSNGAPVTSGVVTPTGQLCTVSCTTSFQQVAGQPVAPCPSQPVAPCPSQPVAPCPSQPVAPCPSQPVAPCPSQPVAPCPSQPVAPCPSQPVAPCPSQPVAPCPSQPVAPCPSQPVAPCPSQPVAPCPSQPFPSQPCPTQPVAPCPTPAPPYEPPATRPPPTTPTPPYVPPATTPPPTTPAPPELTKCPDGTVLLHGVCRLVYCGQGIYRDRKCIQTVCPEGTVWTGLKCAPPEPIVHSVTFNNTVVTHFNRTEPDVVLNNVNNLVVNATIDLGQSQQDAVEPTDRPASPCEAESEPEEGCDAEPKDGDVEDRDCCTVMSPRICRRVAGHPSKWSCFNRRYRRCGDFCVAPVIYLKAPRVQQRHPAYVVVPPDPGFSECHFQGSCAQSTDYYDCSGCSVGLPERCSSYCYSYRCSTRRCRFYDQLSYCSSFPGAAGCQPSDGCYDDWCDSD